MKLAYDCASAPRRPGGFGSALGGLLAWRVAAVSLALALGTVTWVLAEKELVEGIVVRVNERILTTRDFARRVREKSAETGRLPDVAEYSQILEEAVDDMCFLERAGELKVEVDDEEVDASIKQLREQNQVTDEAAFEQTLTSMGLTLSGLKARMRDTLTINRMLSREIGPLSVTEAELQQRYERDKDSYRIPEGVRLEHCIFNVGPDEGAEQQALDEATRLVAAVRSGQEFSKLVSEQVAAGTARGGDLGVVRMPDLRQELASAVATMKPGDISDPIKTASGVHVFRLTERIAASYKPFAEVVDELRRREIDDRYRSRMSGVVEGLKKRYVVETHPELVVSQP